MTKITLDDFISKLVNKFEPQTQIPNVEATFIVSGAKESLANEARIINCTLPLVQVETPPAREEHDNENRYRGDPKPMEALKKKENPEEKEPKAKNATEKKKSPEEEDLKPKNPEGKSKEKSDAKSKAKSKGKKTEGKDLRIYFIIIGLFLFLLCCKYLLL